MDRAAEDRMGILRIYAELDREYTSLVHRIRRAEMELSLLESNYSKEEVYAVWSVIHAREEANQRMLQLACEHMIFQSELDLE